MRREWRATLWAAFAVALVIELSLVPSVLFWPKFAENLPVLQAMAPIQMLKEQLGHIERTGAVGYVLAQHYFKVCSSLGALAAALFGGPAVAGHAQRGTLEVWLSRPRSRRSLLLERYAYGLIALALPIFATSATIPLLGERVDEHFDSIALAWCSLHQALFLTAIYSIAFCGSCFASNPWVVVGTILFASLLEFGLYMVDTATHWSLFRLSDVLVYLKVYEHRALDWTLCAPLLIVSVASLALALWRFERRTP